MLRGSGEPPRALWGYVAGGGVGWRWVADVGWMGLGRLEGKALVTLTWRPQNSAGTPSPTHLTRRCCCLRYLKLAVSVVAGWWLKRALVFTILFQGKCWHDNRPVIAQTYIYCLAATVYLFIFFFQANNKPNLILLSLHLSLDY